MNAVSLATITDTEPLWRRLMKHVDSRKPTSFADHVYLGCTQRECKTSEDIVENYRHLFEPPISAGATENSQMQDHT